MELDFACLEYDITAGVPELSIGAFYDAVRNFAGYFRASCCPTVPEHCVLCAKGAECPYRTVFGQALASDPEIVRLHQKPSLPFSVYIDGNNDITSAATVGLVVVGCAINFIDIFHAALLRMVDAAVNVVLPHPKYTVNTYSLDYAGVRHPITDATSLPERIILLSGQHILLNTFQADSGRLVLKSPLRLLSNGSIVHRFDFSTFFRSQLRRCSSLFAYYGSGKLDLDFTRLSGAAQNVTVFDDKIRYTQPLWSTRRNKAGLTGSAECVGLDGQMFSLLHLGSYFNAGKGASLGAGYYRIEKM